MCEAQSERYGREFTTGGLYLYRDGRDSVAWHGDRIPAEAVGPIVGIVSLGRPRPCRRTWQHAVPRSRPPGPASASPSGTAPPDY